MTARTAAQQADALFALDAQYPFNALDDAAALQLYNTNLADINAIVAIANNFSSAATANQAQTDANALRDDLKVKFVVPIGNAAAAGAGIRADTNSSALRDILQRAELTAAEITAAGSPAGAAARAATDVTQADLKAVLLQLGGGLVNRCNQCGPALQKPLGATNFVDVNSRRYVWNLS